MGTRVIPSYALYGVQSTESGWLSWFDFEWIPQRSRPYNWKIRPHKHDALIQILYLTQGSGEVLIDHASSHIQAPCIVSIPAQTVHGFDFSPDVDGPVVTAAQGALESLMGVAGGELLPSIRKPVVLSLADVPDHATALMPLFLAIEREARVQAPQQPTAGLTLLAAICIQMFRPTQLRAAGSAPASSRRAAQIERFRAMVEENFNKHLPIHHYASALGITAGQLSRLCREVLGTSSLEVINARLVHEAQRALVYTGSSVKQLAYSLGFADETYFCRFFRKHTGMSPKAFRTQTMSQLREPACTQSLPSC